MAYTLIGNVKSRAIRVAWMLEKLGLDYVYVPMARYALGRLRIFYHSDYFRTGAAKTSEGLDARTA